MHIVSSQSSDRRGLAVRPTSTAGDGDMGIARRCQAVRRMAGGLAHELSNLLMVISGHAELLADRVQGDHPARSDAAAICTAVELASRLTSQLVGISGRQVLVPALLDLNDIARDVALQIPPTVRVRVTVDLNLATDLPLVSLDRDQLQAAVADLVANATDATPAGGTITISTWTTGETVSLSVADTGVGIPDPLRAKVFDPYTTAAPLSRRSGLALAAARGFIEQSGGRVAVASQPGRGSQFTMTFPAAQDDGVVSLPPEDPEHPIGPAAA